MKINQAMPAISSPVMSASHRQSDESDKGDKRKERAYLDHIANHCQLHLVSQVFGRSPPHMI